MNVPVNEDKGKRTTVIYKQIPCAVGYYIESDIPEVIESTYCKHFGEDCVDLFVKKMKKIENKLHFFFKYTN